MRKNNYFFYILLIFALSVSGCKSKTIEQEFYKTHHKKGQEIIYQGITLERPFIIYKTPFNSGNTGIGLAVFEGDNNKGWKLSSSNSMYYETELLVDQIGINFDDNVRRYFIYGYIDDPKINKIELTDKYNRIVKANIIETNWKRIFYGLVEINELKIQAFDKNNNIQFEVPNSDKILNVNQ
jgi:hypothetical protein